MIEQVRMIFCNRKRSFNVHARGAVGRRANLGTGPFHPLLWAVASFDFWVLACFDP
jgi:hypothetical protein